MRACSALLIVVAALAAAGCGGGSGEGLDANGRPIGESGPDDDGADEGTLQPTLASIQRNVFTPVCTACHAGAGAPQGLRLDPANSSASLIGVPSNQVPTSLRVAPGDAQASYLIAKLDGSAAVGSRMPFGGPYLDAATIAVIREWIDQGASAVDLPVGRLAPVEPKRGAPRTEDIP